MSFAPLFLLALATASAPPVKQGVDYWQAGDFDRAAKTWLDPARNGDADAQFNLAQAYKLGRGVPMDMRQAENWYRKAAEQNHAQAGAMLGLIMFQNGDRKGAMPWIQKAAERGDPRAQYVYSTALFNGDEIARDWPRAYALMTRAATAGLPQASASLGQMDQFMPLADRQAGLRLARNSPRVAGAEVASRTATATLVSTPPAVRPMALPPSRVAEAEPKPVAPVVAAAAAAPAPAKKLAPARPAPVTTAAVVPKPTPARTPAAAAGGGGWRIQLGAYGDPAKAHAQWSKLAGANGLKSLTPSYVRAGPVTRLQAGGFRDRAAATQACKAAIAAGAQCFAVPG